MIFVNGHTDIGKVVLKTKDKDRLAAFYKEIIGLEVLANNADTAVLGVGTKELLEIVKVPHATVPKQAKTGLYHTAFLLPSRASLGSFLHHMLESQYPLDGAGDHIYSEAFYFRDPDGNGIEVYADRPESEWQRDADGNLPMATNGVDGDGLLMEGAELDWYKAPEETKIGHIHLQVSDLEATRDFYQGILGFKITTEIPSALFFAAGDYHHHIGTNIWAGRELPKLEATEIGLSFFTIETESIEQLKEDLTKKSIAFQENGEKTIILEDPNGITIEVIATNYYM
ncbi:VOC family protein [Listeria weihenstephanensis]|uniref:VOC family protein n=1 Tax=Listeria weihenstephanensis TaxID=1006155 RepID=A0A841Z9E4_9LIST|nr:VOC family protein [Listeria weihenstephanensis]